MPPLFFFCLKLGNGILCKRSVCSPMLCFVTVYLPLLSASLLCHLCTAENISRSDRGSFIRFKGKREYLRIWLKLFDWLGVEQVFPLRTHCRQQVINTCCCWHYSSALTKYTVGHRK